MTVSFSIRLNQLGPSLNKRMHWRARATATALVREVAHMQALEAHRDIQFTQRFCSLTFEIVRGKGSRMTDLDNAISGLKPVIDGLVSAGWLVDDSPHWLKDLRVSQRRDSNQTGVLLHVTITPA